MANPREEIRETIKQMTDAYVNRDLERFQSFFSPDIVALPPGMSPIVGRDDWNHLLERIFAHASISKMFAEPMDIAVFGDTAIEWHVESATRVNNETGESADSYNKGMWVFQRSDGSKWLITHYVWNATPEFEPSSESGFSWGYD